MAFWGIEVKPGKPFAHTPPDDNSKGRRLHISQATLGTGTASNKSVVQCNVGDRSPVFLCSLFPEKFESCQLNLEFEEPHQVLFSVIGPRSVHLTGYYLPGGGRHVLDEESESYGEDIADTETEPSAGEGEDEYEDSFIDDGDLEVNPPSPVSSLGVVEKTSNKDKSKVGRSNHRQLRKKYQVSESDDEHIPQKPSISKGSTGVAVFDSESEDIFPISSLFKSKPAAKSMISAVEEKAEKEVDETCKKLMKDEGSYMSVPERNEEAVAGNEPKKQPGHFNYIPPSTEAGFENVVKPKKKKKRQSEGKALPAGDGDEFFFGTVLRTDKTRQNEIEAYKLGQELQVMSEKDQKSENDTGDNLPQVSRPSAEVVPINDGRLKKKSTMQGKVEKDLGAERELHHVIREDKFQQDEAKAESVQQDMPAKREGNLSKANDGKADLPYYSSQTGLEYRTKRKRKREGLAEQETLESGGDHCTAVRGDEAKQDELRSSSLGNDSSVYDEQKQKQASNVDLNNDAEPYENHLGKKNKRKKKNRIWENTESSNAEVPSATSDKDIRTLIDINNADDRSSQLGLVVEEVGKGKLDGKIAAPGKKITVRYTGKLKTGEVFDSNVDGSPLKFCLGGKEVLDAWNVGLDGLQVGGKRRLIVPPSMGYGSAGDGKKVPPNSWLTYDIELLKVR